MIEDISGNFSAIEGDFIETQDNLIFDVKDFLHPKDKIIAFVRYIPLVYFVDKISEYIRNSADIISKSPNIKLNNNSKRFNKFKKNLLRLIKRHEFTEIASMINNEFGFRIEDIRIRIQEGKYGGKKRKTQGKNEIPTCSLYLKIYDIDTRYDILSKIKPEYIFTPENYDFPLQAVPRNDIKCVHMPEEHLKSILNSDSYPPDIVNTLKKLTKFIYRSSKIPQESMGISGSIMVGLNGDNSDYDLIIYGEEECRNVRKNISEILENSKENNFSAKNLNIMPYKDEDLKNHYRFRAKGFKVS
ncbi:MAG: hypothetical protein ACTSWY_10000, partial [Promethearchaeota archaeon]